MRWENPFIFFPAKPTGAESISSTFVLTKLKHDCALHTYQLACFRLSMLMYTQRYHLHTYTWMSLPPLITSQHLSWRYFFACKVDHVAADVWVMHSLEPLSVGREAEHLNTVIGRYVNAAHNWGFTFVRNGSCFLNAFRITDNRWRAYGNIKKVSKAF